MGLPSPAQSKSSQSQGSPDYDILGVFLQVPTESIQLLWPLVDSEDRRRKRRNERIARQLVNHNKQREAHTLDYIPNCPQAHTLLYLESCC